MRLKDKLGNRSNASAEIEYDGAIGWRIGDEGRGVATILEMVTMTRLDCVLGSAGQMRAALSQAALLRRAPQCLRPPAGRAAGDDGGAGRPGRRVLGGHGDALRLAPWSTGTAGTGVTHPGGDATRRTAALLRLALPVAKFWVCKRAVPMIAEALECLGGNGYVETYPMARLLRESPLNGIWEGSGTVTALDAVRALHRARRPATPCSTSSGRAAGDVRRFDRARYRPWNSAAQPAVDPAAARRMARWPHGLFAASLLIRQAPAEVADLYCATRLGGRGDRVFGELPRRGTRSGRSSIAVTPAPRRRRSCASHASRAHGGWPAEILAPARQRPGRRTG